VASRFQLQFLITGHWHAYCLPDDPARDEHVIVDDVIQAHRSLSPSSLEDFYVSVLNEIKPGLSELIVHPAFDDPEMRAIYKDREAYGAAWRQQDFEVMRSKKFKSALREHGIEVIHWGMIHSAIQKKAGMSPSQAH